MKILVKIGHPAHVHFFKNFVWNVEKKGHQVLICATDKDVALRLLDAYGFHYICICKSGENPLAKVTNLVKGDYRLWQIARKFNPDIITGLCAVDAAHVSKLLRKPSVIFDDTAHARLQYHLYSPFATTICSPSCFKRDLGKKQLRYNGYHELAYLHPNYFQPDPSVLDELGLLKSSKFIVVRFVAWQAMHDIGQHGFDLQAKRKLVEELGKYARVLITSEGVLPHEFEKYRITTSPEKMLNLLFYAAMYIGEGATMASECAVLGTPAIYVNTLSLGYLEEQEEYYGLVYNYTNPKLTQEQITEKALELLKRDNLKEEWRTRTKRLLKDKIDVTEFMIDIIENYPESCYRYKERNKV